MSLLYGCKYNKNSICCCRFANFANELTENDLAAIGSEDESGKESGAESDGKDLNEEEDEEEEDEGRDENEDERGEENKEYENNEPKKKCSKYADVKEESNETKEVSENLGSEEDDKESINIDESSDEECAMDDFTDLMPSINEVVQIDNDKIAPQAKIDEEKKKEEPSETIELDLPFILDGKCFMLNIRNNVSYKYAN